MAEVTTKGKPTGPEIQIFREACISCGACDQACPTDVFRLDTENKPYVAYGEDCQACFLCEFACPTDAIRVVTHRWL
jgi:L-aspartate semialdehyde sulfurtransferase ferredoxin